MAKKIYALSSEAREQECDHPSGFPYRGVVPCTGPQICYLCGTHKEDATATEGRVIGHPSVCGCSRCITARTEA